MGRPRVPRIALLLLLLTAFTACDYVERASVDSSGGDPRGASLDPSISANGRYVVFWSPADDLVAGDGNGVNDVFRRDLLTDTTTRVSVDAGGGDPNGESFYPTISVNGRYVAFASSATDLVPGDTQPDRRHLRTRRLSRDDHQGHRRRERRRAGPWHSARADQRGRPTRCVRLARQ